MSFRITEELKATGVAEVIVVLKSEGTSAASADYTKELKKHFVRSALSQNKALALAATAGGGRTKAKKEPPPMRHYPNLGIMLGSVDAKGLKALTADKKRVARVLSTPVISLIRPTSVTPSELTLPVTWGIQALGVPQLWDKGFTGAGVLVGHLDTGADGTHPALLTAIGAFAEFDDFGDQVDPPPAAHDTDEHGTHTAATIAGRAVGNRSVGVAPGASLASAIVIEGGNVIARILGGMDWVVGQGARVLSMSLGLRGTVNDFLQLTQILRSRGVLPVFAVGNEGPGTSRSPGNYAEALSVGASDETRRVASFSSSQRFLRPNDPLVPDLVAPGVGVISAKPGGGFQSMDGSSMATPHIAGLAAVLLSARPNATTDQLEQAIFRSCRLDPTMPRSRANRGLPNGPRALAAL